MDDIYRFTEKDYENNLQSYQLNTEDGFSEKEMEEMKQRFEENNRDFLEVYQSLQDQTYLEFYSFQEKHLTTFNFQEYIQIAKDESFNNSEALFASYVKGQTQFFSYLKKNKLPLVSSKASISNWFFQIAVLKYLATPFGLMILIILIGLIHLRKYENKNIAFLTTLPIERWKLLWADTVFYSINLALFLVSLFFICYILGFIFGQKLPFDYPVITRIEGNIVLMPVYKILIQLYCCTFLVGTLIYQLCYGVVLLIKKSIFAIFGTVFIIFLMSFFFQHTTIISESFSAYNPFSYTYPFNLFIGHNFENSTTLQSNYSWILIDNVDYYAGVTFNAFNREINFINGIFSLSLAIVIIFLVNFFLINKKRR
ncbi:hypothetical protein ACYSNW_16320 [Enterococcus sp. LJL99]